LYCQFVFFVGRWKVRGKKIGKEKLKLDVWLPTNPNEIENNLRTWD
jgi:hypothetical protein